MAVWYDVISSANLSSIILLIYAVMQIKNKDHKDFLKSVQRAYAFFVLSCYVLSVSSIVGFIASYYIG